MEHHGRKVIVANGAILQGQLQPFTDSNMREHLLHSVGLSDKTQKAMVDVENFLHANSLDSPPPTTPTCRFSLSCGMSITIRYGGGR